MKISHLFMLSIVASLLSACVSYPGAIYTEEVQVGLDVSISTTDTRPVHINLGYDQAMFAIAPKQAQNEEAISLLSKSELFIQFTEESTIQTIFVSGHAAKVLTKEKATMDALFPN